MKKNVSRNKFLTCFRPVVDIDAMLESRAAVDCSASRRFTCIPVGDKHEMKNSETQSMFLKQGCPKFTENWVVPQPPKRRLVKVIKALVVETILNTRAHHKNRYSQDCFGSKRSYSAYTESSSPGDEKSMLSLKSVDTNIKEIKATELSLTSSSSSSSLVSESKNLIEYEDSTKDQLEKQKKFQSLGILLVLISLAVTVLCGKYYGFILTSIWLCFFSLWNASYRRPKEFAKLRNTVSKGYKNTDHNGRTGRKELS